jgi:hypothetical protein
LSEPLSAKLIDGQIKLRLTKFDPIRAVFATLNPVTMPRFFNRAEVSRAAASGPGLLWQILRTMLPASFTWINDRGNGVSEERFGC